MEIVIDPDRPVHESLPLGRWVSNLQCRDTRARVQVVIREQLVLSVTNMRNHMNVCSLVSDFLDAAVVRLIF